MHVNLFSGKRKEDDHNVTFEDDKVVFVIIPWDFNIQ